MGAGARLSMCVQPPLQVGTSIFCGGRGSTTARGMRKRVHAPLKGGHLEVLQWARELDCEWDEGTCYPPLGAGTWRCCSGRGGTAARGT